MILEGVSKYLKRRIVFFFNQSQSRQNIMCFHLLYNSFAKILTDLYASKYLKLDLPAGKMNAKTKSNIYRKVIEEVGNKSEGADKVI